MKQIQINDIIKYCDGQLITGNKNLVIKNFSKDTRTIKKGDIYVAIKGKNFNGNEYIKEAFEKGASACLIDDKKYIPEGIDNTIVYVKDTILALQLIASYKRSLYKIPVIAITGSVGKTNTKELITQVLKKKYKVLNTKENYNNQIGLPLTILRLKDEKIMVLEMGASKQGEISLLSTIAKPDIAIITNIGSSHMGTMGGKKKILEAKLEITDGLKDNGTIVINNDNNLLRRKINKLSKKYKVLTTGIKNYSDYNANDITKHNFTINSSEKIKRKTLNNSYIYNSLNAYSIGKLLKVKEEDIVDAINKFKLVNARLSLIKTDKDIKIINDSYNSSYESIKEAIIYLNNFTNGNKIIVLGDILELGKYSKRIHKAVGKLLLKSNINNIILIGNDMKYAKIKNSKYFKTTEEGIKYLKEIIKEKDTILIKASNNMNFNEIIEKIK